jgi:HEAT repeats
MVLVTLALIAVSAIAFFVLWPREPVYEGKRLSYWVDKWAREGHGHAESVLLRVGGTNRNVWTGADLKKRRMMIRALQTKDCIFWKPYTRLKFQSPKFISKSLPDWAEPAQTRLTAVNFFTRGDFSGDSFPREAIPILYKLAVKDPIPGIRVAAIAAIGYLGRWSEGAMPLLLNLAESHPDSKTRSAAIREIGRNGYSSARIAPLMLKALTSDELSDRESAAKWFGKTTLMPEKAIPELVRRLEDPGMKSDAASALVQYSSRAQFTVPKLIELAKGNDRDISSVATWALLEIDRDAAAKAGIKSLQTPGQWNKSAEKEMRFP